MFTKLCGSVFKGILTKSHAIHKKRYLHQTHYDVLGVPKNCSTKDIKEAFIRLSKKYHPDKNTRKSSHKHFVRVLEAYSILSKPGSRRTYDWELTHTTTTNTVRYPSYEESPQYRPSRRYPTGYGYDDPSFWANRAKYNDQYHQNEHYYGVPGVKKISNAFIAVICIFFTTVGVSLQYLAIRHSVTLKREALQRRSVEYENVLAKLEADAKTNGRELQIELVEQRFQGNKYYSQPQHTSKD